MKQRFKQFLRSIAQRINGPHVCALLAETENGYFVVDPEDLVVGEQLRMQGRYGLGEIEMLKTHITPTSKVLIVGGHVGTLAIPLSKCCEEVVAIEANPNTFSLLKKNIALNDAFNCRAINIAASDKEEKIDFLLSRSNSGGSKRVPKIKEYMYYYDDPEEISVQAHSLDKYLGGIDFDVIVMDIEGSEYFALKGMQVILSKAKLLAVEFLPHHLKNVSSITVEEFLSVIPPHFSRLTIPSTQTVVAAEEFLDCLSGMYAKGQGDNGIIFEKVG